MRVSNKRAMINGILWIYYIQCLVNTTTFIYQAELFRVKAFVSLAPATRTSPLVRASSWTVSSHTARVCTRRELPDTDSKDLH